MTTVRYRVRCPKFDSFELHQLRGAVLEIPASAWEMFAQIRVGDELELRVGEHVGARVVRDREQTAGPLFVAIDAIEIPDKSELELVAVHPPPPPPAASRYPAHVQRLLAGDEAPLTVMEAQAARRRGLARMSASAEQHLAELEMWTRVKGRGR